MRRSCGLGCSDRTLEQAHAALHRVSIGPCTGASPVAIPPSWLPTKTTPAGDDGGKPQPAPGISGGDEGPVGTALGRSSGPPDYGSLKALAVAGRDVDLETGRLVIQRSLRRQPGGRLVFVPPNRAEPPNYSSLRSHPACLGCSKSEVAASVRRWRGL